MAYQSKTYSLSDEVVAAIEAARELGLTPNRYLRQLIGIDSSQRPMKEKGTLQDYVRNERNKVRATTTNHSRPPRGKGRVDK